jgi:GMP synthase (glutamine-hydrolysing)
VSADRPTLLAIRHVPWETPHRILDACGGLEVVDVAPLAGEPLPDHAEASGAVVMGGPMNADEVERYPGLAAEREWLAEAVRLEMPVLGVCLGAQLLARSLGAEVRPGERPEIGFAPVEIHDPTDPVVGPLAPSATVLHWHGDVFDLPPGAQPLASSEQTQHQAFRAGNARGLLFHAEADAALVESWLAVPQMATEAREALGMAAVEELPGRAQAVEPDLIARSTPGFQAFASLVASHRPAQRPPAVPPGTLD